MNDRMKLFRRTLFFIIFGLVIFAPQSVFADGPVAELVFPTEGANVASDDFDILVNFQNATNCTAQIDDGDVYAVGCGYGYIDLYNPGIGLHTITLCK